MQETFANHGDDISFALSTVVDCLWNPSQTRQHSKPSRIKGMQHPHPPSLPHLKPSLVFGSYPNHAVGRRKLRMPWGIFDTYVVHYNRDARHDSADWFGFHVLDICCIPDCKAGLGEGIKFFVFSLLFRKKMGNKEEREFAIFFPREEWRKTIKSHGDWMFSGICQSTTITTTTMTKTTNIIKEEWQLTGTEGGLWTTTKSSSRWTMLTASPITGLSCLRSRFYFVLFVCLFFKNCTVCLSIAIQSAGRKQNATTHNQQQRG